MTSTSKKGKTISKFKRTVASLLAAVMMMTTAATISASANDQTAVTANTSAGTEVYWASKDNYSDLKYYKIGDLGVYYSNQYFDKPSTTYDPHLATVSMVATDKSGAFSSIKEGATPKEIHEWCLNQPAELKKYFTTLEFNNFDTNEDYVSRSRFDTIGVAAASKTLTEKATGENYTVIAVVPRSGNYFQEWSNNIWLGDGTNSDYMHEGWYNAANKMISYVKKYVKKYNITGKVKLWMSGFSRGGATVNLAAGLLDNMLDKGQTIFDNGATLAHDDIFAYTFEAPQGANVNSKTVKKPKDKIYNNIWNIVNPNDLVPKVAMAGFGFTRFGTDKFITTRFFNPECYETNRETFRKLYTSIGGNWNDYKADNFQMYGITAERKILNIASSSYLFLTGNITAGVDLLMDMKWIEKDNTKANYDANIACTVLLEELEEQLGSREAYAQKIQLGLRDIMKLVMEDQEGKMGENINKTLKQLPQAIIFTAIGGVFGELGSKLMGELNAYLTGNNALNLGDGMFKPLLSAIKGIYKNKPNELISVGMQMSEIFQNHNTYVIIAHMMAQDTYYTDRERSLSRVRLSDCAEMFRVSCDGMNDSTLKIGNTQYVRLAGTKWGRSTVEQCDQGFAVGYYSYASNEKTELFAPVGRYYTVGIKDHSKQLWSHKYEYWVNIQHSSLGNDGKIRKQLDYHIATCHGDSDEYWHCYDTLYDAI